MTSQLLEALQSGNIQARAGVISGSAALHGFFASREEIRTLKECVKSGLVDEESIRAFVSNLLRDLQRGVHFPHDLTLAALAVALEDWAVPFAEEYLRGVTALKSAEMPYGLVLLGKFYPTGHHRETMSLGILPEDSEMKSPLAKP